MNQSLITRDVFPARLRELRGNESQAQFAARIGIARPSVASYEKGLRIPPADYIAMICKACGVSADWLLGLSDVPALQTDFEMVCENTAFPSLVINELEKVRHQVFMENRNNIHLLTAIHNLTITALKHETK